VAVVQPQPDRGMAVDHDKVEGEPDQTIHVAYASPFDVASVVPSWTNSNSASPSVAAV